jgi:predicted nucleic acid-binding Zn finger protein
MVRTVTGSKGGAYRVDVERGTCECADHVYRKRECKHLRGLRLASRGGQYAPAGLVSKRPGAASLELVW